MEARAESDRAEYLHDLRMAVNACSPWLLRDLLQRWAVALGPLAAIVDAKPDSELRALLIEVDGVLSGQSSHQLASQLAAPWLMGRSIHP
ncbi:hypothetical protein JXA88_00890 [Candidatus Fermentibacteria bacterium]|nr:hypothetical protein [Candidatus Fermentibacteria bacterium]